jgi:hypothetical protein
MRIRFYRSQKVPSLDFCFLNVMGLDNGAYSKILGVTQMKTLLGFSGGFSCTKAPLAIRIVQALLLK